jgi:hypothetical protein
MPLTVELRREGSELVAECRNTGRSALLVAVTPTNIPSIYYLSNGTAILYFGFVATPPGAFDYRRQMPVTAVEPGKSVAQRLPLQILEKEQWQIGIRPMNDPDHGNVRFVLAAVAFWEGAGTPMPDKLANNTLADSVGIEADRDLIIARRIHRSGMLSAHPTLAEDVMEIQVSQRLELEAPIKIVLYK